MLYKIILGIKKKRERDKDNSWKSRRDKVSSLLASPCIRPPLYPLSLSSLSLFPSAGPACCAFCARERATRLCFLCVLVRVSVNRGREEREGVCVSCVCLSLSLSVGGIQIYCQGLSE